MEQLQNFIEKYFVNTSGEVCLVDSGDLKELKDQGHSVEDLLNYLCESRNVLLHGSRIDISDNCLHPNDRGEVFASDVAGGAIMKAILSRDGLPHPGLRYPLIIDEKNPPEVRIYGFNDNTIGERGFVYVIPDRGGFENKPAGSWQYVSIGKNVPITAKVEVLKEDFNYPVFDVTQSRRVH